MSLFSSIGKALGAGLKTVGNIVNKIPGASVALKAIPGLGTAATVASVAGAIGGIAKPAVKTAARVIPGKGVLGKAATVGIATTAYNVGSSTRPVYDQNGTLIGYRPHRRRMNFGNVKAAKRAGRRIKGTIKLLNQLEKSLPHKIVHRRAK